MKIKLKLLSSLAKVFLDSEPVENPGDGKLTGFLNETVSFQAAWGGYEGDEGRSTATLTVTSPIASIVHVRQVRHIPVRFTTYPDADANYLRKEPGLFPDLLSEPKEVLRIWADKWESAWIDVTPDENTVPGVYPIELTLTEVETGVTATRVMQVEILPAKLPPQTLIHTKWFYCDCLCQYYGVEMFSDEFYRIAENFIAAAVRRGINMMLTPIHTPPLDTAVGRERMTSQLVDIEVVHGEYRFGFDNLRRWVAMCKRCGVKYYEIAHFFSQWGAKHTPKIMATVDGEYKRIFGWETDATGPEYTAFLRAYIPAVLAELRALGVDKQCWFHISDEPSLAQLEDYKAAKAVVSELLDGYPIMDALSDYGFYTSGAVAKPIPANNHIAPFIEHGVQGLWTYYCCGQYIDVSNMFMAMPSARNRILGVQLYKFNIEGFLQWGYNSYNSQNSYYPVNPYLITDGDGFVPAGDTFQVYPGPGGVPEESIRMMVTDEALFDLRAFRLLESLRGRDFVMGLIENGLSEPITFDRYPTDDSYLLRLREKVNREIVKALA